MRIPEAVVVRPLRGSRAAAFVAAALVVAMPLAVSAHDPGLSALDVRIETGAIRITLSLAPADVRQIADGSIESLVRDAVTLAVDGVPLADPVERGAMADSATLVFSRSSGTRLSVRSDVPQRLAIGHRQLLTVHGGDGRLVMERMLDARSGAVDIELASTRSSGSTAVEFFRLGLVHILGGYDHLLFLVALLLGVRCLRAVAATVTAFTVAHSVTLSMSVLGIVAVAPALVEPLIAASIVFVGIENLSREQVGSRWRLTFLFGLVHGFGFAGALRDLGVGAQPGGVILPLASFNLGVEAGQLAVVLAVWPLLNALNGVPAWKARLAPATSLGVVAAGCYWLVERIMQ